MPLVITIFVCLAILLLGCALLAHPAGKPLPWIAILFGLLALLLAILGSIGVHIGR